MMSLSCSYLINGMFVPLYCTVNKTMIISIGSKVSFALQQIQAEHSNAIIDFCILNKVFSSFICFMTSNCQTLVFKVLFYEYLKANM